MNDKEILASLATQFAAFQATIMTRLDSIDASNKEQSETLKHFDEKLFTGNGNPSMSVEIDRLKQKQISRDKQMGVLWTLIVGILVALATIIGEKLINHSERQTSTVSTTVSTTGPAQPAIVQKAP